MLKVRTAVSQEQWKNFIHFFGSGKLSKVGYVLTALADCNLHEMLVDRLDNAPLARSTALHVGIYNSLTISDS